MTKSDKVTRMDSSGDAWLRIAIYYTTVLLSPTCPGLSHWTITRQRERIQ